MTEIIKAKAKKTNRLFIHVIAFTRILELALHFSFSDFSCRLK